MGKLFFDFLKFYAIHFESNKDTVRINGIKDYDPQTFIPSSDLIIVDPLNPSNNVAKSCLQFYNIKMSFIICLMALEDDCECGCHYNQLGENNDIQKVEHCLLKRLFNSVKRFG